MSTHISGRKQDVAETVLLPGDPLRAKNIADNFLTDVVQFTIVRNMLGFTGTADGRRISVMGGGMGQPSLSIYVNELVRFFGVKRIIRVGSCGSLQADVKLRDVILAQCACTDSALNSRRFHGMNFAPPANWDLLLRAYNVARGLRIPVRVGNILASDTFYSDDTEEGKRELELWAKYGVLAVEMETAELYTLGARRHEGLGFEALAILTVSDIVPIDGRALEVTTAEERQNSFNDMVEIALKI